MPSRDVCLRHRVLLAHGCVEGELRGDDERDCDERLPIG
jgi:hypothetical protein